MLKHKPIRNVTVIIVASNWASDLFLIIGGRFDVVDDFSELSSAQRARGLALGPVIDTNVAK